MAHLIHKDLVRLRRKTVLGPPGNHYADVETMPEGHMICSKCGEHKFEAWWDDLNHRLELGCMHCSQRIALTIPRDIDTKLLPGRFVCFRHGRRKGMVVIKNIDVLSVGCELCRCETNISLKTKSLIVEP